MPRFLSTTFETLFASTPNDDGEPWTVTGPATTNAIVRISDAADLTTFDDSDSPFTISQPPPPASITVTVPNGPENWPIGTTQTIQWTSQNLTGNVKIELSRNGGEFQTLFANTANDGSQPWTVTSPATFRARIRISSVNDPAVNDQRDLNFADANEFCGWRPPMECCVPARAPGSPY